ncbi:MAG: sensor histidine kinase [Bacteroidota bacterium]
MTPPSPDTPAPLHGSSVTLILLFILLSILQSVVESLAQSAPVQKFTEESGLPGNSVRDIIKDQQGNLWIGTDNGLSKFDGTRFTNFYKDDGLPGNRVWALAATPDSSIYVGCYLKGLCVVKDDNLMQVPGYPETHNLKSIRQLHYSQRLKALLIGTDQGLYILKNKKTRRVDTLLSNPQKTSITSIREEGPLLYYSVHSNNIAGLFSVQLDSTTLAPIQHERLTTRKSFESVRVDSILYDSYFNQLTLLDEKTFAPLDTLHTDKEMLIWDMAQDEKKNLWLAGFGHNYNKGSLKIVNTKRQTVRQAPYQVYTNSLSSLYYDMKNQIMWAGSSDNGLFAVQETPFSVFQSDKIKGILDISPVSADSLYVLTKEGLFLVTETNAEPLLSKQELERIIGRLQQRENLSKLPRESWATYVWHSHSFQLSHIAKIEGHQFLATNYGSISIRQPHRYLPLGYDSYLQTENEVYYAMPYNPLIRIPSLRTPRYSEIVQTSSDNVRDIKKMVKHDQRVYAASYFNGVYAIQKNRATNLNSKNSQLDDNITDLVIGPDKDLWCISNEGHLFQLDISDSLKIKKTWSRKNNLQGNQFKWLVFQEDYLFLGSNKGLNVIPISELSKSTFQTVYFYNAHNNYTHISADNVQKDNIGNIYLHTFDKIITITNNYQVPVSNGKLVIQSLRINNKPLPLAATENHKFKHHQNSVSLKFLLRKYPNSHNTTYRYRINSEHWQNSNTLHLQQLRPGKYVLELEARDPETSKTFLKSLSFNISKPWWQHPFMLFLLACITSLLIFLLFRYRLKKERRQQQERHRLSQEMAALQIRSLQGQMNPHFLFNSLNSIQNQMLANQTQTALGYLNKLAGLMRTNLNYLGREFITLEQEIAFVKNYLLLEKMRFKDKLDYSLNIKVDDLTLLIPPMMVQPLVENSIKHGLRPLKHQGNLTITFSANSTTLTIIVTDNGIGRKAAAQTPNPTRNNGKGISLIQRRLELLNKQHETSLFQMYVQDLYKEDDSACGTSITLSFLLISQSEITPI